MKEIILPTELMAFFILNMFGHDSALHDFSTSSELGKGRVLNVLRSGTPSAPGSGSLGGGTWSGKGGGDEELNHATGRVYGSTVGSTLYSCLRSTGFFDTGRHDITKSDSFIIVDAKLAMGPVFTGKGIKNMGIAPGFIYLPERTYSPFEFEVIGRSTIDSNGFARDMILYKHYADPLVIQINRAGPSFNCSINRNSVITSYNLLSSVEALKESVGKIIATNPDVSDAFMSNAVSTSITNYIDHIQLLLDGADSRYTFILTDYIAFGCMSADENDNVQKLKGGGKKFLVDTITGFWRDFIGVESATSMLSKIPAILTEIDKIQKLFAVIYKAILCAVGTAVKADLYSCTPPPIAELKDLNNFYLANKSQLEMFVYEYMVSSINFGDEAANLKDKCNTLIQGINANEASSLSSIIHGITTSNVNDFKTAILTRLQSLSSIYGVALDNETVIENVPSLQLFLTQYPVTYFVNIETPSNSLSAVQLTTFINFLQIVSDTLIDKETNKEETQEQKENEVVYVDNVSTLDAEDYIRLLTNLQIIAAPSTEFTQTKLNELIKIINETLRLLLGGGDGGDYIIILTDAVGSKNVEKVHSLLAQNFTLSSLFSWASVSEEEVILLQTLFLDLINRLDSFQLQNLYKKLITGQSAGSKIKPIYLFVFNDAENFFIQLTNQNRLTKTKAKFKELFDTTDVLPAFYTDSIIQPTNPNALSWTIDYNYVFFGFFLNSKNLTIKNIPNMIASIDSGVIFPQIPSNVIDVLTLDNVLTQLLPLIQREKIILLKKFGDDWLRSLATAPSSSEAVGELIKLIRDLVLPGIFVKPDEGSDIFWRFEQGYIYLLKCVMLYYVLVNKKTTTLIDPNNNNFILFFILFFLCTTRYLELLTKIDELLLTSSLLSGAQKICTGYALGSILTSVMTEMRPIISSFKNSALLNIETTEISRILAKKANASTILQSSTFGDNDTKLYNKFINWVDNNIFQRGDNTVFSHNENINGSLGTSLKLEDAKWNKQLITDINAQYGGEGKFYINNAVNAPSALGKLDRGYFCPAASIMDNQSTCSTKTSAEANEGFEVGVMDFVIHDGRPFGQSKGIPSKMIYRVRVVPIDDGSTCKIGAYLSIEGKVLINVTDVDIWAGGGSNWPNKDDAHPAITVPLNSKRGDVIPMDAKTCLKNIFTTIDSAAFKAYNTTGFQSLIDALDKPETLPLRRLILESSFVKGLGDFLQEGSGFVENSGYEAVPFTNPDSPFIQPPNHGRLQLNNDRPSSVRAILLVLYGKGSINPNVIAGFLTEMKDKKKIPKSKYALAGRLTHVGGRNTKKTKASKRNKNTRRRRKMKTRVNKRSKRQKRLKVRKTRKVLHRVKY